MKNDPRDTCSGCFGHGPCVDPARHGRKIGPIEAELRGRLYGSEGKFSTPNGAEAWRVYEAAHRELMVRHTGEPVGAYVGCCVEAMSEAIEAAEALGL